jgi:hypothetical protein
VSRDLTVNPTVIGENEDVVGTPLFSGPQTVLFTVLLAGAGIAFLRRPASDSRPR